MKESTQAAKEALEWYQEIAESALRYSAEKKGEALAAIIVNLSTDAGNRATKGIEALAGAKWASPSPPQKSKEEILDTIEFQFIKDEEMDKTVSVPYTLADKYYKAEHCLEAMQEYANQFTPSDKELIKALKQMMIEQEIVIKEGMLIGHSEGFKMSESVLAGYAAATPDADSYKREWELSEKAHSITTQQLMDTQDARNRWREMCIKLAEEMRKAEWDSPLYWEFIKLKASFETGNG